MLWLHRPPYLRWLGAAVLVAGAFALDITQRATQPHPFVAAPVARGTAILDEQIEWRDVPTGLLDAPDLANARASRDLVPGEPILLASLADAELVPAGWWSIPLVLPGGVEPGARVRVVAVDPVLTVDGIVVSVADDGAFTTGRTGLVAVPEPAAAAVAAAAAAGSATVLFAP